jgi:hypothetical protein
MQTLTSSLRRRSRTSCWRTTAPCWLPTPAAASPRSAPLFSVHTHTTPSSRSPPLTSFLFAVLYFVLMTPLFHQVRRPRCPRPFPEVLPLNCQLVSWLDGLCAATCSGGLERGNGVAASECVQLLIRLSNSRLRDFSHCAD